MISEGIGSHRTRRQLLLITAPLPMKQSHWTVDLDWTQFSTSSDRKRIDSNARVKASVVGERLKCAKKKCRNTSDRCFFRTRWIHWSLLCRIKLHLILANNNNSCHATVPHVFDFCLALSSRLTLDSSPISPDRVSCLAFFYVCLFFSLFILHFFLSGFVQSIHLVCLVPSDLWPHLIDAPQTAPILLFSLCAHIRIVSVEKLTVNRFSISTRCTKLSLNSSTFPSLFSHPFFFIGSRASFLDVRRNKQEKENRKERINYNRQHFGTWMGCGVRV